MAKVSVGYTSGIVRLTARLRDVGIVSAALTFGYDIVRARNRIAAQILREYPHATRVLWWDDDAWPEDIDIVQRMIETGEDFIAAAYTNRTPPTRWVHDADAHERIDARGLLRAKSVGFGFTMTSIACLRRVSDAAETYWDIPKPHDVPDIFGLLYGDQDGRRVLMSEDRSFCKRWRDLGGTIWVDGRPGNVIHHAGDRLFNANDMGQIDGYPSATGPSRHQGGQEQVQANPGSWPVRRTGRDEPPR